MKKHCLVQFALAIICAFATGCTSLPKDQVRVSTTAVFSRVDVGVCQLKIETQKSENFRLIVGRMFEFWGDTAPVKEGNRQRCQTSVWLVGSQIIYEGHNFIKMDTQGCGKAMTFTQEVAKDDKLSSILDVTMLYAPIIHQLNQPLVIGKTGDDNIWLTVGPAVYEQKTEHNGPATVGQPIRSETNRTSPAADSRR
jgi:hypothetical protein